MGGRVIFSAMLLISQIHLTTNCKIALQNASSCVTQETSFWGEGKVKRWEGCLRFHLQKKFHYKTYFPLPEERITRISFCKNLPESQFLCYRKVITNVDIASRQKRGFARRKEDTVSRTALLLFLTSEIQPYCIALWKSLAMPQVPPHQSI